MEENKQSLQKENSFDAAPGGSGGSLAYGPTMGTFASPSVSQNPAKFQHYPPGIDVQNSGNYDKSVSVGMEVTSSFNKDVDQLFKKKVTPSPDQVLSAMQFEMGKQISKNKRLAKQVVLQNLKLDPLYYNKLSHLNIDEPSLTKNINENKDPLIKKEIQIKNTKELLNQMISEREKKYIPKNPALDDVLKSMESTKKKRRSWLF